MTSGSVQLATTAGTGTSVPPSAASTVYSRLMSCAVGSTWPSGGRRSTIGPAPLSRREGRVDPPPLITRLSGCVLILPAPSPPLQRVWTNDLLGSREVGRDLRRRRSGRLGGS